MDVTYSHAKVDSAALNPRLCDANCEKKQQWAKGLRIYCMRAELNCGTIISVDY